MTAHRVDQLLGELTAAEKKFAPKELYLAGDESLLTDYSKVSIVGARNASDEGLRKATVLARALVELDIDQLVIRVVELRGVIHEGEVARPHLTVCNDAAQAIDGGIVVKDARNVALSHLRQAFEEGLHFVAQPLVGEFVVVLAAPSANHVVAIGRFGPFER